MTGSQNAFLESLSPKCPLRSPCVIDPEAAQQAVFRERQLGESAIGISENDRGYADMCFLMHKEGICDQPIGVRSEQPQVADQ